MKKVLLLTDIPFWEKKAGNCTRISGLIRTISPHCRLSVVFIGPIADQDKSSLSATFNCSFLPLTAQQKCNNRKYQRLLEEVLRNNSFDFCIVEYIHISYYLDALPDETITILDIHDIQYQRSDSFLQFGYDPGTECLSKEMELNIYRLYDYIITLCEPDYRLLEHQVGPTIPLLCPHPAEPTRRINRNQVSTVGFIGSAHPPNIEAIRWFLEECWPVLSSRFNVTLNIFGTVSYGLLETVPPDKVRIMGFEDNLESIYAGCDVAINPVRFGAGVKIKTIEALSFGLPLVTTPHGARGLEKAPVGTFLTAETREDFIAAISLLINNPRLRDALSENALRFVGENLLPEICFRPLLNIIDPSNEPTIW